MLVKTHIAAAMLTALMPSTKSEEALLTVLIRRVAKRQSQAQYISTLHPGASDALQEGR